MEDSRHNPEGYLDLTAYKAIEEIPQAGEVWTYERKPGKSVEVLIIRNHGTIASSMVMVNTCYGDCVPVRLARSNQRRFTNPQMLSFVLVKKLRERVGCLPAAEFAALRRTVVRTIVGNEREGRRDE